MSNYILYKNIPSVDLHGCDRISASILVKEFINNSYKMKYEYIEIIHGIGEGILKREVHKILSNSHLIDSFEVHIFNSGITVAKLKKFKD